MRQLQSRVQRIRLSAARQQTQAKTSPEWEPVAASRPKVSKTLNWPPRICPQARSAARLFISIAVFVCFHAVSSFSQEHGSRVDTVRSVDRVHQGDIIEVDVVGSFEFDWRGGLNADGYLDGLDRVPDAVFGRCRSTEELAGAITERPGERHVLVIRSCARDERRRHAKLGAAARGLRN